MTSRTVLIAGGTGMIGTALQQSLREAGHTPHVLSRAPRPGDTTSHRWNPGVEPLDLDAFANTVGAPVDAVVNLAGASISHMPWTADYRREILQSRLAATETITDALRRASFPPRVLVNGSAVGFYGSRGEQPLAESAARGTGFLADVVEAWEHAASAAPAGVRVALARTGIVLGPQGALTPLKLLTRLGVSGPLAGGRMWWPWISLRDEVRAIEHVIEHEIEGPVNLAGPQPATAGALMRELAHLMRRPYWLPAPGLAISVALGQAGRELLLTSARVEPAALLASGFSFLDTSVEQGLRSALGSGRA